MRVGERYGRFRFHFFFTPSSALGKKRLTHTFPTIILGSVTTTREWKSAQNTVDSNAGKCSERVLRDGMAAFRGRWTRARAKSKPQFRSQIDRVARRSLENKRERRKKQFKFLLSREKRELLDFPTHFFTFFLSVEGSLSRPSPSSISSYTDEITHSLSLLLMTSSSLQKFSSRNHACWSWKRR